MASINGDVSVGSPALGVVGATADVLNMEMPADRYRLQQQRRD